jgi:hypothetical protein
MNDVDARRIKLTTLASAERSIISGLEQMELGARRVTASLRTIRDSRLHQQASSPSFQWYLDDRWGHDQNYDQFLISPPAIVHTLAHRLDNPALDPHLCD